MSNLENIMATILINGMMLYHTLVMAVSRVLYIAGLRLMTKAKEVGTKHADTVYDMWVEARGQDEVDEILNQLRNQK